MTSVFLDRLINVRDEEKLYSLLLNICHVTLPSYMSTYIVLIQLIFTNSKQENWIDKYTQNSRVHCLVQQQRRLIHSSRFFSEASSRLFQTACLTLADSSLNAFFPRLQEGYLSTWSRSSPKAAFKLLLEKRVLLMQTQKKNCSF